MFCNVLQIYSFIFFSENVDDDDDDSSDSDESSHGISAEKCLLTTIWGLELSHSHKYNIPEILCTKLLNLSEAIHHSQLKVRPFQSLVQSSSINAPHFPTIHSALNDLPRKPCVLLKHQKKEQQALSQNQVLAVKPVSLQRPLTSKNISGFSLALCMLKKSSRLGSFCDSVVLEEKRKPRRRQKFRNDSGNNSFSRIKVNINEKF